MIGWRGDEECGFVGWGWFKLFVSLGFELGLVECRNICFGRVGIDLIGSLNLYNIFVIVCSCFWMLRL